MLACVVSTHEGLISLFPGIPKLQKPSQGCSCAYCPKDAVTHISGFLVLGTERVHRTGLPSDWSLDGIWAGPQDYSNQKLTLWFLLTTCFLSGSLAQG